MRCPPCIGNGLVIGTLSTPCPLCKGRGQLPDDRLYNPQCPACVGNGLVIGTTSSLCTVCGGWGRLPSITQTPEEDKQTSEKESLAVSFIDSGKPRTAHIAVHELLKTLSGSVRICDPYYGTGMLYRLDSIIGASDVRILTQTPDSKEKSFISKALTEFRKEHPHTEFRKTSVKNIHDRYILTDNFLIILGQGLKDIGAKQSFVLNIPVSLIPDIATQVASSFDSAWQAANPIP